MAAATMLAVEDVVAGYGESMVVCGATLSIAPGQVACLMGRNGVGKSTLLKTVMGVLPARSGSVRFGDQELTRRPVHERARAGIAYVPQGRGVFPYLTVRENVLMGLEAEPRGGDSRRPILNGAPGDTYSVRMSHLLAGVAPRARQAPPGTRNADSMVQRVEEMYALFPVLRTMEQRLAGTLSGGQQQQLAIARALISRPTLLLLDEPTEGIQPSIIDHIEELLMTLRAQRTMSILLVEQFLDFALGVADYCYVMEKGEIVSQGTPQRLSQDVIREHLSV
ncbi:MAG: ATP-binding cassette domain-containing protein [Chloroflexota bacterium]|nr:ATP-binding cassette domain-containing protein [Chloroflexota bacterium]